MASRTPSILAAAAALIGVAANAAAPTTPAICAWNAETTAHWQRLVRQNDPATKDALAALKAEAAKRINAGPYSVVDKEMVPPSGDKHDLVTLGRYYWPNPKTPDGLPWIVLDGKTNPDYFDGKSGDTQRLFDFHAAVITLARTAYFTGDSAAGARETLLLHTWFIDPATRMNPNANYAARLPGKWDGQALGILSTVRPFTDIMDSIELLQASGGMSAEDHQALVAWFGDYLNWLTTSKFGQKEAAEKNNHGTANDVLIARIALFIGKSDLAKQVLEEAKHRRIDAQIEPDGSQPLELHRTKPWDYSRYNVEFMFRLAMLGDIAGVDLWHYRSADGRSIRAALDYLVKQLPQDSKPDAKLVEGLDPKLFGPVLQTAARVYDDPKYLDAMRKIGFDGQLKFLDPGMVNGVLSGPNKDKSK